MLRCSHDLRVRLWEPGATVVHSAHPFSLMRLTFVTDLGQTYTVEIDPKMELENVMALLEAEVSDSRILYLYHLSSGPSL